MTLERLIRLLEAADRDTVCPLGLTHPHSWRGDYTRLAFSVGRDISVRAMLDLARDCVGRGFEGWKGGNYRMRGDTIVHVANEGESGGYRTELDWLTLAVMLGDLHIDAPGDDVDDD